MRSIAGSIVIEHTTLRSRARGIVIRSNFKMNKAFEICANPVCMHRQHQPRNSEACAQVECLRCWQQAEAEELVTASPGYAHKVSGSSAATGSTCLSAPPDALSWRRASQVCQSQAKTRIVRHSHEGKQLGAPSGRTFAQQFWPRPSDCKGHSLSVTTCHRCTVSRRLVTQVRQTGLPQQLTSTGQQNELLWRR